MNEFGNHGSQERCVSQADLAERSSKGVCSSSHSLPWKLLMKRTDALQPEECGFPIVQGKGYQDSSRCTVFSRATYLHG